MAHVRSRAEIEKEMSFVNNSEERKRATDIHRIVDFNSERPLSTSSHAALEFKEKAEELANDLAIGTIIQEEFEQLRKRARVNHNSSQKKEFVIDTKFTASLQLLLFNKLPLDISKYIIVTFLEDDLKTQAALLCTCKYFVPFFQAGLTSLRASLQNLLQAVIEADLDEAKKLITQNPKLLLKRTVISYSGKKIKGTALQLALGAEDLTHHNSKGMVEMITEFLQQLPNGEIIIRDQIKQQFPDGWEEKQKKQHEEDMQALLKVINKIADSKEEVECKAALDEFKEYLKPKTIISSGKHFNTDLLYQAFYIYDQHYKNFFNQKILGKRKSQLLWDLIIHDLQHQLPACYAQIFNQGLRDFLIKKKPLVRNLNYHTSFEPITGERQTYEGRFSSVLHSRSFFNLYDQSNYMSDNKMAYYGGLPEVFLHLCQERYVLMKTYIKKFVPEEEQKHFPAISLL